MTKIEKLDRKYSKAQELIEANNDGSVSTDRAISMGIALTYLDILRTHFNKKDDCFSVFDDGYEDEDSKIRKFEKELDRIIKKYQ